ncbi:MAG: ThuA domain-containing protein [Planctomycetes bacterium]|nr:ThuA domain-containing protein [Planctomycetota bacterium]
MERSRKPVEGDLGSYCVVENPVMWDPAKTALVICDMWDLHHCKGATSRVAEMAPRVNEVANKLRDRGVLIIHCPSSTLGYYKNHPGRKLAQAAPPVQTKIPLKGWCSLDREREGALPIDDSDGGCDTPSAEQTPYSAELKAQGRNPGAPWMRQIATIKIKDGDAITDNAEAFYLMKQRGITHVIVLGVHTNMCVLGRPFSIRQLVMQGQHVTLMRDLTDTMYNPAKAPFVSHFTGTDLVVEHIEKHWCSTITSDQVLGGKPLRFAADRRKRMVLLLAEEEYRTTATVPEFALAMLGRDFKIDAVLWDKHGSQTLVGLADLDDADIVLMSVWRRTLPREQLDKIRKYLAAGKPLVAIRTSSHGFSSRDGQAPPGSDQWPDFDRTVLGGHYRGHHGNHAQDEATTSYVWIPSGNESHPILKGIAPRERRTASWLYKMSPLAPTAKALMMGRVGNRLPQEPVAWTNVSPGGGRIFYTSLGHPEEFKDEVFRRLLRNATYWAVDLPMPSTAR